MKFDNPWMMLAIIKEHVRQVKKDKPEAENIIISRESLYLTAPSLGWYSQVENKYFIIAIKDLGTRSCFKLGPHSIEINDESADKLISLLKTCSGRNVLADFFNGKCNIPELDKVIVKILKLKAFW